MTLKNKNILKKSHLYILLIIICIMNFNPFLGHADNELAKYYDSSQWSTLDIVSFFGKSIFSKKFSKENKDFFSSEIPKISGIEKYRVLPLNQSNSLNNSGIFKIALPYKSIISISKEGEYKLPIPLYQCNNKIIYIYSLDSNDALLILNQNHFLGNRYEFTIFKQSKIEDTICNISFKPLLEE